MSAWAKPGARCVCVNAEPIDGRPFNVVKGATYTVAALSGDGGIHLVELPHDTSYYAWRFRPLVERTQEDDFALFKHLLNTTPVSEDA